MAPTLIQAVAANGDGDTAFVITGISPTVAGRLLSVVIGTASTTVVVNSVTDNTGNTYAKRVEVHTQRTTEIWDCPNASGGVTDVTVTVSSNVTANNGAAVFHEIDGAATASHTAGTSTGSGATGPSMSVGSFTPSEDNCLIIAGGVIGATVTFVAGAGYTLSGAQGFRTGSEYQAQTTATATTAPLTGGASAASWCECAIAYKAAAAPGGANANLLSGKFEMKLAGKL